jgi:hypothetical protein
MDQPLLAAPGHSLLRNLLDDWVGAARVPVCGTGVVALLHLHGVPFPLGHDLASWVVAAAVLLAVTGMLASVLAGGLLTLGLAAMAL